MPSAWFVRRVQWSAPRRAPHSFLFWFSVQFCGSRGGLHRLLTRWIISHFRAVVKRKFWSSSVFSEKTQFHLTRWIIPHWKPFVKNFFWLPDNFRCPSVFRVSVPSSSMNLSMFKVKRYVLLTFWSIPHSRPEVNNYFMFPENKLFSVYRTTF